MFQFDPHQYVIDAGWDLTGIELTAEKGVADGDKKIIREMAAEAGLTGLELDTAVAEAIAALLAFCHRRLQEHNDGN